MNLLPWKLRELTDKVTNVVMNYTEVEARVRESTNDEPWGPSGTVMQELANDTFMYETFNEVTGMLWKRIFHEGRSNWRRIYKGLLVVSYLLRNGSERFVTSAREHVNDLRALQNFTFHDEHGKDQGVNVRNKSKELVHFLKDNDRLREERKKARKNKNKYVGMSNDDYKFGRGRYDEDDNYKHHKREQSGSSFQDESPKTKTRHSRNESNGSIGYSDDFEPSDSERNNRNSPKGVKYNFSVDSLEVATNPKDYADDRTDSKYDSTLSNSNSKPRRPVTTSKRVSLGAAAQYTGDQTPSVTPTKASNNTSSSDPLDLFASPVKPKPSGVVEDLFSDFDSLANSRNTVAIPPPNSKAANGDFADFEAFQSNGVNSPSVNILDSQSVLSPTAQSPQQNLFSNNLMSPNLPPPMQLNMTYNNPSNMNMMQAAVPVHQLQTTPVNFTSPVVNVPQNNADLMAANQSMAYTQPQMMMQPIAAGITQPGQSVTPSAVSGSRSAKANTWSDVKGVNINLDFGRSSQKAAQPSMRQMQQDCGQPIPVGVNNITMGMGSMNVTGQIPGIQHTQMPGMAAQHARMNPINQGLMGMPMQAQPGMMQANMMGVPGQMNQYGAPVPQMHPGMGMYGMANAQAGNMYNKLY